MAVMLTAAVTPATSADSGATSSDIWECTITIGDGDTITTKYAKNGADLRDTDPVRGFATGSASKTSGSWGFDEKTGFGPFGSFYAAFDPENGNEMVCHLKPGDLTKSIDGKTDISGKKYNVMWCLPKIYLSLSDNGKTLKMTNDESKGWQLADAFTLKNGNESISYNYLALGVYEASNYGGKLYSRSGVSPTTAGQTEKSTCESIGNFQTWAKNSGAGEGGHSMIWNFYQWQLYRFCSLAVMENFNSQQQIGMGNVSGSSSKTGTTDSEGPYYGTEQTSPTGEKLFIENAWGNVCDYVGDTAWNSGLYAGQNSTQVCGTTGGLKKTSVVSGLGNQRGMTPDTQNLDTWGLPTAEGSSGYDTFYTKNSGSRALIVGGGCKDSDSAGLSYVNDDGDASTRTNSGSRLAFLFNTDPKATIVPEVTYDHSNLVKLLKECGLDPSYADGLPDKPKGEKTYDYLGEVAEFKHAGWIIDGELYPAEYPFVTTEDHVAASVWIGLPAVTYDHSELVAASKDQGSEVGLSQGIEIKENGRYEQLPSRDGFSHVGWRIIIGGEEYNVGPTDKFVSHLSHTAYSQWEQVPMVIFDHSNLTGIVGKSAKGVSDLETSMLIQGNGNYPQLPNTAGYRHIGWDIGGKIVDPTAALESQETHDAKSLWEKIPDSSDSFRPIPIIPGDEGDSIEVVVEKDSEPWLGKNGKTVLLTAVVVAIIAELAVLCISRKR